MWYALNCDSKLFLLTSSHPVAHLFVTHGFVQNRRSQSFSRFGLRCSTASADCEAFLVRVNSRIVLYLGGIFDKTAIIYIWVFYMTLAELFKVEWSRRWFKYQRRRSTEILKVDCERWNTQSKISILFCNAIEQRQAMCLRVCSISEFTARGTQGFSTQHHSTRF